MQQMHLLLDPCSFLRPLLSQQLLVALRLDRTGRNSVDANSTWAVLNGKRSRQPFDSSLRSHIWGATNNGLSRLIRGEVHNCPLCSPRKEATNRRTAPDKHRRKIQRDQI